MFVYPIIATSYGRASLATCSFRKNYLKCKPRNEGCQVMKLLFIDFNLPYLLCGSTSPVGGWAIELYSWIKGFTSNGHHVGVLTWKGANKFVNKKLEFDLIETFDPDKGFKILKYFSYYIPEIYKKSKQFAPDVIIQACASLHTGIMKFVAGRLNVPFIYRVANDMDTDHRYRSRLKNYEQISYKYGLKASNAIICQNSYQYNNLKTMYPNKLLYILHNPFHIDSDIPITTHNNRKYIAWIGIFQKQKNLALLFSIAELNPQINFRIAGSFAKSLDDETKHNLSNLKKLSNIQFVGYLSRNEIIPFLSKSIALLNTSHYEGFSNTFLEAFSSGTPVIAPTAVDPDHIIEENGLGFAFNNYDYLREFIQNLYDDQIMFNEISEKCIKYVKQNHNPKILSEHFVECLTEIIIGKNNSVVS